MFRAPLIIDWTVKLSNLLIPFLYKLFVCLRRFKDAAASLVVRPVNLPFGSLMPLLKGPVKSAKSISACEKALSTEPFKRPKEATFASAISTGLLDASIRPVRIKPTSLAVAYSLIL